jgi:hypothetical protein
MTPQGVCNVIVVVMAVLKSIDVYGEDSNNTHHAGQHQSDANIEAADLTV